MIGDRRLVYEDKINRENSNGYNMNSHMNSVNSRQLENSVYGRVDPLVLEEEIRRNNFDGDRLKMMHDTLRDSIVYSNERHHLKKPKYTRVNYIAIERYSYTTTTISTDLWESITREGTSQVYLLTTHSIQV